MPKINATAFDADGLAEFLGHLDQIHLVAIHSRRHGEVKSKNFGADVDAAVEWAQGLNADQFGIYWTVNRVPDGFDPKPAKHNIKAARFVHLDVDPPRGNEFEFSKAATIETLENMRCPATLIISSGNGIQAFWQLDDDYQNGEAIEHINLQVRHLFSADACQNLDRLMRAPGTVNWPSPVKEARGRKPVMTSVVGEYTGQVYSPEELRAAFPPIPEAAKTEIDRKAVDLGAVEYVYCDTLALTPFHPVRRAIEKPKGSDRSAYGYHAAAECVRHGLDDTTIAGLLLNPANEASGHFIDQADPMRAVKRAIGAARGDEDIAEGEIAELPEAQVDFSALVKNSRSVTKLEIVLQNSENVTVRDNSGFDWYPMLTPGLRLMVDTIMRYAPSPRAELALAAALSCFATASGRRYASPTNVLTNMYCVALMASGAGKEFPLRSVEQVLTYAGAERMVGGRIVSATGIRSALEKEPALFVPAAEFGKLIEAMNNPRGVLKDAVAMLLELYSEAQSFTKGGMYANAKERQTVLIHHPCLTLYGVSTPAAFWEGLTSAAVADGFLARMVLFIDDQPEPMPRFDLTKCIWPDALTEHIAAIVAGAEGHTTFPMGEIGSCKPYTVPYADDAAREAWQAIRMEEWQYRQDNPNGITAFNNRMAENATKLALVRAIDRDPAAPKLTADDFAFGYGLAKRSIAAFHREIADNLAENELHARELKVLETIRKAGADGLSTGEITKRCPGIPKRIREELLEDLLEQGKVRFEKVESAGRPKIIYRAV